MKFEYLYIEASEIYLLLCVFIENCAVLTNYLLLLLDTPDRFFPPISSVTRSPIYFHGGKRINKSMKGNLTGKFLSSVISVQNCSLWFPVLFFHLHLLLSYFFFTYMCFSLTLLPTMHTFCSRDHLWQTLMLYIFWLQSNLLTTQEKKTNSSSIKLTQNTHTT